MQVAVMLTAMMMHFPVMELITIIQASLYVMPRLPVSSGDARIVAGTSGLRQERNCLILTKTIS